MGRGSGSSGILARTVHEMQRIADVFAAEQDLTHGGSPDPKPRSDRIIASDSFVKAGERGAGAHKGRQILPAPTKRGADDDAASALEILERRSS